MLGGLGVTSLSGGGGGIGVTPPSIVYASQNSNSSNPINTVSRATQNLGTETPTRQMLLLLYGVNANLVSDSNWPTCTVGGVSATRIYNPSSGALAHFTVFLTPRTDNSGPTGSSGTVAVTRSTGNGFESALWGLWAVYDLITTNDEYDQADGTFANPSAISINTPASGVAAFMAERSSGGAYSWSGASEDFDTTGGVSGAIRYSGASINPTTAQTGLSVEATSNGSNQAWGVSLS
jgi:hypothetical protein